MNRKRIILPLAMAVTSVSTLVSGMAGPTHLQAQTATSVARSAAQQNQELPSAKSLVQKFAEASGGLEKLKAIKTVQVEGTLSIPAFGINGDIEITQQAPNLMRMSIGLGPAGQQLQGYNGEIAWQVSPQGAQILGEEQTLQMKQQSDIVGFAAADKMFDSMETTELTKFQEQDAYVVVAKKEGLPDRTLYFAKDSGFLIGTNSQEDTPLGRLEVTTVLSNYEKVDDVVMCKKLVIKIPQMEQTITMKRIQLNKELPEDWNELPAAIKSQLK